MQMLGIISAAPSSTTAYSRAAKARLFRTQELALHQQYSHWACSAILSRQRRHTLRHFLATNYLTPCARIPEYSPLRGSPGCRGCGLSAAGAQPAASTSRGTPQAHKSGYLKSQKFAQDSRGLL